MRVQLDTDRTAIVAHMGELCRLGYGDDAGLAQHLKSVGFDSATETLADPAAIRNVSVSGCGSISCS